jgi:hypothetical protein
MSGRHSIISFHGRAFRFKHAREFLGFPFSPRQPVPHLCFSSRSVGYIYPLFLRSGIVFSCTS